MSRTGVSAALVDEPASSEAAPLHVPMSPAPASPRRLQDALADLGPGRPSSVPSPAHGPVEIDDEPELSSDAIVQALAEITRAAPASTAVADTYAADYDDEDAERPPMVIEKAIAAQQGAAGLAGMEMPSVWPGLATGFTMAIATGVGLYYMLAPV